MWELAEQHRAGYAEPPQRVEFLHHRQGLLDILRRISKPGRRLLTASPREISARPFSSNIRRRNVEEALAVCRIRPWGGLA